MNILVKRLTESASSTRHWYFYSTEDNGGSPRHTLCDEDNHAVLVLDDSGASFSCTLMRDTGDILEEFTVEHMPLHAAFNAAIEKADAWAEYADTADENDTVQ